MAAQVGRPGSRVRRARRAGRDLLPAARLRPAGDRGRAGRAAGARPDAAARRCRVRARARWGGQLMAWFRVDDSFQGHPKAVGISNDSLATWTRGGQWCAWQLTDGVFARAQIAGFAADAVDPDAVERDLVHRRLWEAGPEPGTLQFHDWEDWQPTRQQVLTRRKADAKRKADARARKDSARNPAVTEPVTDPPVSRRESDGSPAVTPHGIRGESALPDPTRPSHKEDIVRTTRTGSGADSERTPDDDDDSLDQLDNMIVAMLAAHGAVTRQQATAWRLALMAAKPLSDPRAYIARTIR